MISGERIFDAFYTIEQNNSFYEEQKVDAQKHWDDTDSAESTVQETKSSGFSY